jgi:hypothetical protein
VLKRIGLQTPYEQYILYGSIGTFLYGAYTPFRQYYFLSKWLRETDPVFKDIFAARGKLSEVELRAGSRYLELLKKSQRNYAFIPLSFLAVEAIRYGYRRLSGFFPRRV